MLKNDIKHTWSFLDTAKVLGIRVNTPAWPDAFGVSLRDLLSKNKVKPIPTLSLFSGAGGLDIGFSDAGFQIIESVEFEEKFCKTLEMNASEGRKFEGSKVNCIDIRNYRPSITSKIDFIIGGPPCQTFSAAGRRANGVLGTTDARGVLFREYVRLLDQFKPKGFLFENVYGITGAQGGAAWKEIQTAFARLGYRLFSRILDAADYGVPQHRERLIIVGLKNVESKFDFPRPTHGPDSVDGLPFYSAGAAVQGLRNDEPTEVTSVKGRYGYLIQGIPPGLNYSFYTEEMGHPRPIFAWRSKFSDFMYKADPEVPVRTIKASGGAYTGPLHWDGRFFTLSEYKRLQTFPDDYGISGVKQIAVKQIGNSVPPQLARVLALAIRKQVFGTKFPFEMPLIGSEEILSFRSRKAELTKKYRERARSAIAKLRRVDAIQIPPYEYDARLDANFKYLEVKGKGASVHVKSTWTADALRIFVQGHRGLYLWKYTIKIRPSDENWVLPVPLVEIKVNSSNPLDFVVAWKALDYELSRNSIKADLVQLNNYYQYEPRLICETKLPEGFPNRKIIESVVRGENVRSIINANVLAKSWGVRRSEVVKIAGALRRMGYEIRNHRTNPQIPNGEWLIPYCFPTLTNLSVQLNKKVR